MFNANASKPIEVHTHKVEISGVLPEPYLTLKLEVELDIETDDVKVFDLYRGKEKLTLPLEILEQLKSIELNTIKMFHEMHRVEGKPAESQFGEDGDWLHINMQFGEPYRAEKERNGKDMFCWGRDTKRITIDKKGIAHVQTIEAKNWCNFWHEKTW
jgi:hypothetical protein